KGRTAGNLAALSPRRRTRWGHRRRRTAVRPLPTPARRSGWRGDLRGEHRPLDDHQLADRAARRWAGVLLLFGYAAGRVRMAKTLGCLLGHLWVAHALRGLLAGVGVA